MRAIVSPETSAYDFTGFLLRFDVDAGINSETALGDASRIFVFELLADEFNRIIEWSGFVLRLVISRVGKLNWFGFRGIDVSLTGETILRHQIQHQVTTFFRLGRI